MATNINTILSWFKKGLKPTQNQFWASWTSFWHKDEKIPQSSIADLSTTLNSKAEKSQLESHIDDRNAHINLFAGKLTGSIAIDAETQIIKPVEEDNKVISRSKLFNWFDWIKKQSQSISGSWYFSGVITANKATLENQLTPLNQVKELTDIKEDWSKKTNNIIDNINSTLHYPSVKGMVDYINTNVNGVPYLGSIVPSSVPSPTGPAIWTATQAGTYINFGGVIVNIDSFATISRNAGGTYSISQTPLNLSSHISINDLNYLPEKNFFNKTDNNLGGHTYQNQGINNLGVIGTYNGWVGAKIPVSENTIYSFKHDDDTYRANSVGLLAYLNSSGNTILTVDMSTLLNAEGLGGKKLTTPPNTAFIYKNVKVIAGATKDYIETFQLELGSLTTSYMTYKASINKIKDSNLLDSIGRSLTSNNAINLVKLSTELDLTNDKFNRTENWTVKAKGNTTNTNLIQLAFTIDTDDIVYAINDIYGLEFTLSSLETNINSTVKMRSFQNAVSDALAVASSISTSQQTIGIFNIPSSFISTLKEIKSTERYLHIYLELTLNTPTQLTSLRYESIKFKMNGITKTPLNWVIYRPNDGEVIKYEPYLQKDLVRFQDLTGNIQNVPNYLSEKKMINIGDSMVKGHNLAPNFVWDYLISQRNEMNNVNYGINGTQLTNNNSFGESVLSRYSAMDNDADYIGVFAGTNDAAAGVIIGNDVDSYAGGQLTFKGALNDLCNGLIDKYPDKKIYFVTPYNRNAIVQNYVSAIINICKKYSIPVFDNWTNGGICWANTQQTKALTLADTYHLNQSGMMYASLKYESFLRLL